MGLRGSTQRREPAGQAAGKAAAAKYAIQHREDEGIESNRQRQRGQGYGGEAAVPAQSHDRLAQVSERAVEPAQQALVTDLLRGHALVAAFEPGLAAGFVEFQAAPESGLGLHLEVELDLVLKVLIQLFLAEDRP